MPKIKFAGNEYSFPRINKEVIRKFLADYAIKKPVVLQDGVPVTPSKVKNKDVEIIREDVGG